MQAQDSKNYVRTPPADPLPFNQTGQGLLLLQSLQNHLCDVLVHMGHLDLDTRLVLGVRLQSGWAGR